MHAHYQDLFVIGTIENSDVTALRQAFGCTPHEVMAQVVRRRSFEGKDLAALRIHSGHNVLDHTIFAGRVHGLKNHQHRPAVLSVKLVLEVSQFRFALVKKFLRMLLGTEMAGTGRIKILQAKFLSVIDSIRLCQLAGPGHTSSITLNNSGVYHWNS